MNLFIKYGSNHFIFPLGYKKKFFLSFFKSKKNILKYNFNILKDRNIDLAVISEGEITLEDIIQRMLNNNYCLPTKNELANIPGIAYYSEQFENRMVEVTVAIPITKNFDKIMKMGN